MKKGDLVKITDGSYAVRVDSYEECIPQLHGCPDIFKVVGFSGKTLESDVGTRVHDIFIKNTVNFRVYLHSSNFVQAIAPTVKEVTMEQVEKVFNCKVKIVK